MKSVARLVLCWSGLGLLPWLGPTSGLNHVTCPCSSSGLTYGVDIVAFDDRYKLASFIYENVEVHNVWAGVVFANETVSQYELWVRGCVRSFAGMPCRSSPCCCVCMHAVFPFLCGQVNTSSLADYDGANREPLYDRAQYSSMYLGLQAAVDAAIIAESSTNTITINANVGTFQDFRGNELPGAYPYPTRSWSFLATAAPIERLPTAIPGSCCAVLLCFPRVQLVIPP